MKKNIQVNISISQKLLSNIEKYIEGKNRSAKMCKVVTKGYEILTQK